MRRVRHEYFCRIGEKKRLPAPRGVTLRPPTESDIQVLAELMLDAYQGTIDYDGEKIDESLTEVRSYFDKPEWRPMLQCSFLAVEGGKVVSACLISKWEKRPQPLISYLMTRSTHKGRGLATVLLNSSLIATRESGYSGGHAFVTEGNIPSEKLVAAAGFLKVSAPDKAF